jgi:hypothetical protein
MGLRFRRSVKLMPGIRVNFSGSGASLSLGGRGATINVSSRGTRATVGLPGTGLSYSASSSSSGTRRRSAQQIAAAQRRTLTEQRHADAVAEIERVEQELLETVSAWRQLLDVTEPRAFESDMKERSFAATEQPPTAPDFGAAERAHWARVEAAVRQEFPLRGWQRFLWAIVGVLTAMAATPVGSGAGVLLAGPAAVGTGLIVYIRWVSRLRPIWVQRGRTTWPAAHAGLEAQHAQAISEHNERERVARAAWAAADQQRIAELRHLMAGQIDAIEQAVTSRIEAIDFPFEAVCAVAVDDEDHVLIDVDLPEIEDVVPETQLRALKSGALSDKKRKVSERNELYAELVCGIAFAIAATAFSAAPTLSRVTVAGRTQRQKRASLYVEDDYVYEVEIPRAVFTDKELGRLDPVDTLRRLRSRLQLAANGALKKIAAPAWAETIGATELAPAPLSRVQGTRRAP